MTYTIPDKITQSIFRAYDIRGIVATELTENTVYAIGLALGSIIRDSGENSLYVGRDGRLTGATLMDAFTTGLQQVGCNVIEIEPAPTPVLYYACATGNIRSGVMITGSHNPPEYNGLKMVVNGKTLIEEQIQELYQRIITQQFYTTKTIGTRQQQSFIETYIQRITDDINITRQLHVVIDCGNGIAGAVAPSLFTRLLEKSGGQITTLYADVDGTFPNHHPDPSIPETLTDLIDTVKKTGADIGLAFDGDGDRLGVVTNQGNIIWPDRQLMLFAKDVLSRNPNSTIIYDVKCSKHIATVIEQHHGKPLMWKTGHSLIKNKLAQTDSALAGEMSGHIFFKERWYGFDDGLYCAARLLEIISQQTNTVDQLFATIPDSVNTPELKLPMPDNRKVAFMQQLQQKITFTDASIITIDGLRIEFADGWGLIRPSNTTPYLTLRFEADNQTALSRIIADFREQLLKVDPTLVLPDEMQVVTC